MCCSFFRSLARSLASAIRFLAEYVPLELVYDLKPVTNEEEEEKEGGEDDEDGQGKKKKKKQKKASRKDEDGAAALVGAKGSKKGAADQPKKPKVIPFFTFHQLFFHLRFLCATHLCLCVSVSPLSCVTLSLPLLFSFLEKAFLCDGGRRR